MPSPRNAAKAYFVALQVLRGSKLVGSSPHTYMNAFGLVQTGLVQPLPLVTLLGCSHTRKIQDAERTLLEGAGDLVSRL